ncbi:Centriolin [Fukomys damarensis]|uniref:Centriolin n=1 Tax=Fukomys damarensis TaxID=885580 RepID=A0A091CP92_FUKDA|nr:Centriolin [Fukomys damarensis]
MDIVAMDAENQKAFEEQELQEQHEVNTSLKQTQGELSTYEAGMKSELKLNNVVANQLMEELDKLTRFTHRTGRMQKIRRLLKSKNSRNSMK